MFIDSFCILVAMLKAYSCSVLRAHSWLRDQELGMHPGQPRASAERVILQLYGDLCRGWRSGCADLWGPPACWQRGLQG